MLLRDALSKQPDYSHPIAGFMGHIAIILKEHSVNYNIVAPDELITYSFRVRERERERAQKRKRAKRRSFVNFVRTVS